MTEKNLAVVLAAGEGTRMRSLLPKVLHPVGGRPMVLHALHAVREAGVADVAVVVGPDRADVAEMVKGFTPQAQIFTQNERRGTAHAVLAARQAFENEPAHLLVLFGDTPLLQASSLKNLLEPLQAGAAICVAGFEARNPTGYGRLITDGDQLLRIVEEKEASVDERKITFCNAGMMALHGAYALALLDKIDNKNRKGEFYLTDIVELARGAGHRVAFAHVPETDAIGVNDRVQLAAAEALFQDRMRHEALAKGVTLVAPETVMFSADTVLGEDVTVEPYVVFGPGVVVDQGAEIRAFSHLEGAHVRTGAQVGPYARLRPGTMVGVKARIGNFVEIKKAVINEGAKINHLSYVGDAVVGIGANIGAGTITCNYDGVHKYKTRIGDGAFVGSNSALVAPVTVGDGAFVGAGSVITEDVPAHTLALARGRQVNKPRDGA